MSEGLAYVGKIIGINPIENADRIEHATAVCGKGGKWSGIIRKGDFREGDLCQVILQDAVLPEKPRYEFLAKQNHRVRMMRMRGIPSECLILPLDGMQAADVGTDVTSFLGIVRYQKAIPLSMQGETLGPFPSFIPKTDEPNFQGVPELVDALRGKPFCVTVKVDGTSTTAYKYKGHFGVCSRNWEKKEGRNNALWRLAIDLKVKEWLPDGYAIQWETVGPGIQKNPLGLSRIEERVFDIYDIEKHRYLARTDMDEMLIGAWAVSGTRISTVPIAFESDVFEWDDETMRLKAEGQYSNGHQREGIVIRPQTEMRVGNERVSFKAINLKYKD